MEKDKEDRKGILSNGVYVSVCVSAVSPREYREPRDASTGDSKSIDTWYFY